MKQYKRDAWIVMGLVILAVITRIPLRSQYLYHWDSVNFAIGLRDYNIAAHQPHPPGYFLYSQLGTFVNSFVHDENASLVWISLVSGVIGVAAIYWIGLMLFERRVALLAAILTLVSPLHWFYSETALSYQLEFVFVIVIAGMAYLLITGNRRVWPWLALTLAIAGGFRLNAMVFLLPLWLLCLLHLSWKQRIFSVLILIVGTAAWVIPMIYATGGPQMYLQAISSQGGYILANSSLFSIRQMGVNFVRTMIFTFYGLTIGLIAIPYGLWLLIKNVRALIGDRKVWVLGLWLLPSLVFYSLLFVRQHGYIFTFLPALILITAFLLDISARRLSDRLSFQVMIAVPVILANALFFLFAPSQMFGSQHLVLQTPGRNTITQTDQTIAEWVEHIQANFEPSETAVFASGRFYRHPDYYFSNMQLPTFYNNLHHGAIDLDESIHIIVLLDHVYPSEVLAKCHTRTIELSSGIELQYVELKDHEHFQVSRESLLVLSSQVNQ